MFKKAKEEKQKIQLINEINEAIYQYGVALRLLATETCEDLPNSGFFYDIWYILALQKIDDYRYDSYSLSSLKVKKENLPSLYKDLKENLLAYWDKVKDNKDKLDEFFKKGSPLFIKMTSMRNNRVKYALCYELKKYENNKYKAYVFTDDYADGQTVEFTYLDYALEQMTEEEFEQYYIMGRLKLMTFRYENDAIEYDNELRRLFHGQREII